MSPTTSDRPVPQTQAEPAAHPASAAAQMQRSLRGVIGSDCCSETVIAGCLETLRATIRPAAIVYYRSRSDQASFVPIPELSPPGTGNVQGRFHGCLDELCEAAGDSSSVVERQLTGNLTAVAVPVLLQSRPIEVIGLLTPTARIELSIALSQVVASHISLAESVSSRSEAENESADVSALVELLAQCQGAPNTKHASSLLANELKGFLGCVTVVIGRSGPRRHGTRLMVVSGMSKFDAHSDFATAIEAALDEAIVKDCVTVLPTESDLRRTATLAHQRAMAVVEAMTVVSSPLKDESGNTFGAWMFFGQESEQLDHICSFVRSATGPVGSTLHLLSKATENPLARQFRAVANSLRNSAARAALLAATLFLGLMLLPMPYKIGCECQVQPVVRRFVAAPHDGKLERTFVEPGDEVRLGDLLARLDGRELRWELAGLEAGYNRAEKTRDAAMAADSIGEAQQAALEKERLQLKIELIRHRLENLEVRSPLDGIVISGDLRKAEGAPLTIGQTMFEIAPLDRMVLEVEIPEREVLHIQAGQQVAFRVDADLLKQRTGQIRTVFPQSEIRDNASVYVAEVDLDNHSTDLRPGMKGYAKVISSRHALGWNLFHRPFESFCMLVGW